MSRSSGSLYIDTAMVSQFVTEGNTLQDFVQLSFIIILPSSLFVGGARHYEYGVRPRNKQKLKMYLHPQLFNGRRDFAVENCRNKKKGLRNDDQKLTVTEEPIDSENTEPDDSAPTEPRKGRKNKCCPYDFDSTFCRAINDRVICGYNKNKGKIKSRDTAEKYNDRCNFRNGRYECGYENPPFNERRPPAWNHDKQPQKDDDNIVHLNLPETTPTTPPTPTTKSEPIPEENCVEKGKRIVCTHGYPIKNT